MARSHARYAHFERASSAPSETITIYYDSYRKTTRDPRVPFDSSATVLVGDAAEFRLDPLVAKAALRTPDTSPSKRGADWVRFSPAAVDGHAVDRAQAWLASAWRRAQA